MPDDSGMESERDLAERTRKAAALKSAVDSLEMCGFSGIVLMATYEDEDGESVALRAGRGNWYTQYGLIQYMCERRTQHARLDEIADISRAAREERE